MRYKKSPYYSLLSINTFRFNDLSYDSNVVHFLTLEDAWRIIGVDACQGYSVAVYPNALDNTVLSVDTNNSKALTVKSFLLANEHAVTVVELRLHRITLDGKPKILVALRQYVGVG